MLISTKEVCLKLFSMCLFQMLINANSMISITNFNLCHCTDPSIWKWADGSQLNYTNWVPGFPVAIRNDCVQLEWSRFNSTKWYNTPCKAKRHFICQAPKGIPRISYSLFSCTCQINEACIKYTSFH